MNTTTLAAQAVAADNKPTAKALHLCSRLQGRVEALAQAIGSQDERAEAKAFAEIDHIWTELLILRGGSELPA